MGAESSAPSGVLELRAGGSLAAGGEELLGGRFFGRKLLRLLYPARHTARQADLFADAMRIRIVELGDLLVVEDAEIVELLLDRGGNTGELLEIVGNTARP